MYHHQPTTIAILGADTLFENILARLLEEEGYSSRLLEACPVGFMDELLDGVDVLLLVPRPIDGVREAFLEVMRSSPGAAHIPILPLSLTLKEALLDELGANASWRSLFEELVREIEAALRRVEVRGAPSGRR